jgi:hypothetical protein
VIKPEQIPDEVVKAARHAFYNATGPTISDDWRAALTAGLAAWPGGAVCHYTIADMEGYEMVLPLTQENNNGSD